MADQSDVETVLVGLVAAILYPQGQTATSILGRVCRIYRGWPNSAALDADLAAGVVNVTVFPQSGHQRNTTRWLDGYEVTTPNLPTLAVVVSGASATFSGLAGAGQLAGLLVDRLALVHRTAVNDTPASVAAILAAQLTDRRVVQLDGATLTIPGVGLLVGRVVADQMAQWETRRQRQGFRVTCWCSDPVTRDRAATAIDAALSAQTFIALPDGRMGRLRFVASTVFDQSQDAALYRRDLLYSVDYATIVSMALPSMIFGDVSLASNTAGVVKNLLG